MWCVLPAGSLMLRASLSCESPQHQQTKLQCQTPSLVCNRCSWTFAARGGRCWHLRNPCIDASSARAHRCWHRRNPCTHALYVEADAGTSALLAPTPPPHMLTHRCSPHRNLWTVAFAARGGRCGHLRNPGTDCAAARACISCVCPFLRASFRDLAC